MANDPDLQFSKLIVAPSSRIIIIIEKADFGEFSKISSLRNNVRIPQYSCTCSYLVVTTPLDQTVKQYFGWSYFVTAS